jgi:hypothetical protein
MHGAAGMLMPNEVIPYDADQPNTLRALVRKRAEVAGQIEHIQCSLRHCIVQLEHIDATIRIFNPSIDACTIRAKAFPPRRVAARGEVLNVVFNILREAQEAATSREIAYDFIKEQGLNPDDMELLGVTLKRVHECLKAQRKRGLVRNIKSPGDFQRWEVVR